jgi:hypothetical protein
MRIRLCVVLAALVGAAWVPACAQPQTRLAPLEARRLIASQEATFEGPIDTSFVEFAQQYLQAKR